MPLSNGWTNITIRAELKQKLEQLFESEKSRYRKGSTFTAYVNGLLWEFIENDEHLRRYGPFLKWIGPHDNLLLLYDNALERTVEVEVREKELYCREDKENDCVHVGFCFAIPEVYRIISERGFKPPKVKAK